MILFGNSDKEDKRLEKRFFLAIYIFTLLAGIYTGMYCYRFGVLVDLKHHLQAAKYDPTTYFKYLTDNSENSFPKAKLDFKFKHYIKLSNQRSRFVYSTDHFFKGYQWFDRENFYVKADFKYKGEKYKTKVKLFGKNNDHFRHPYKWSFRSKTKDYVYEFNNEKFNILQPNTRGFLADVLCNKVLKKHGFLNLEYYPINLEVNNRPSDIYLIEDFFSKNIIERNEHRDSYIFSYYEIKHPSLKKLSQTQIDDVAAIKKDIISNPNIIINRDKFDFFIAMLFMAQNKHPMLYDNFHLFYNSVDNRVEPMLREIRFDEPLAFNSVEEFKEELKEFLLFLKQYGEHLDVYLDEIVTDNSRFEALFNSVVVIANDINEITLTEEWQDFKNAIYSRYPQAVYLCKNISINTNEILKFNIEIKEKIKKKKDLRVIAVNMSLDEDLILNDTDLIIESGVTLDLNGNNIIIDSGKIEAIAFSNSKIKILNTSNDDASIVVKNADGLSRLSNVHFQKLSGFNSTYWHLPAGITFYESDVEIDNSQFEQNKNGDDYINFFRCSYFKLDNVIFRDVRSDAIDSDFSSGVILNSGFFNIGNDAIDASGSTIAINNCQFDNIEDKVISAGEDSKVVITESTIMNSEISFVAKDDSELTENRNTLINNNLDYCIFNKKEEFKDGTIFSDKDVSLYHYLIEKGSKVYQGKTEILNLKLVDSVKESLYGIEYGKQTIRQ